MEFKDEIASLIIKAQSQEASKLSNEFIAFVKSSELDSDILNNSCFLKGCLAVVASNTTQTEVIFKDSGMEDGFYDLPYLQSLIIERILREFL